MPEGDTLVKAAARLKPALQGHRQPCHRCGTPIRMTRHGDLARSTYWCPTCQPR